MLADGHFAVPATNAKSAEDGMNMETKESVRAFKAHLDRCSKIVAGWPAWKRGALDGPRPRPDALPLITPHECDAFEDVATNETRYARHDPTGEGVEYCLIQPHDLQRFCHTVRTLLAASADNVAVKRR